MSVTEINIEKNRARAIEEKKYPKIPITTTLSLDILLELEAIGRDRNVRTSQLLRLLTLRGLAAYYRDGLLEEQAEKFYPGIGE